MKTPQQIAEEIAQEISERGTIAFMNRDGAPHMPNEFRAEIARRAIEADRLQRPSTDALEQALTEWNAAKLLNSVDEEYDAAQEMGESIEEYLNDLEES